MLYETGTTFRVWAPRCQSGRGGHRGPPADAPDRPRDDGLFELALPGIGRRHAVPVPPDGERYRPDPASRFQPEGVHGPSVVVDAAALAVDRPGLSAATRWPTSCSTSCTSAPSRAAGTFEAVIPHLPQLVELGVTAIELMPVGRVPRLAQLGLRRRPPVRAAVDLWRTARAPPAGRRRPRLRAERRARRGLQPPRPRGQLPGRVRPVLHRPLQDALGHRRSTSTGPTARVCGATSSTTPGTGSASSTSTACGWTPSIPSSTPAPSTS